jgi:hypothetical protein
MRRTSLSALVCVLSACSGGATAPSQPYLSVEISSISGTGRQVSTTVTNISGEALLVGSCIVDLQLRVADAWQFQDTGRACPGMAYHTLDPETTLTTELTLPADAPACEYRLVASAATAQPHDGESTDPSDRSRESQSPVFCVPAS